MQRLAIVTGGSRGLGAALVEAYAADGWDVLEFSRSGAATRERVTSVRLDLARPEAARETFLDALGERLAAPPGEVHFVHNAAVLAPVGPPTLDGPPDWREHLDANVAGGIGLMGAFLALVEPLTARKVLVNVSSGAAKSAVRGWSLYCASKAACEHWIRCVALEQADLPRPTLCVSVAPGIVDTAMQEEIRAVPVARFPDHERFVGYHEGGNLRAPDDVARDYLTLLTGKLEQGAILRV